VGVLLVAALPLALGEASLFSPVEVARAAEPASTNASSPAALAPLSDRLDAILDADFLANAKVSVAVVDLRDGSTVYARNSDTALNPASNVKLVTTAAALEILGPEHRFATRALVDPADFSGGVVDGPIYLQGSGDPSLVTGELYELATHLRAAGIERIAKGEKATATTVPRVSGITLVNESRTVEGSRNRLTVHVEGADGATKVFLRGEIGERSGAATYRYPVSNPSQYAGETFRSVLKQAGIKVPKKTVKVGDAPSQARVMASHRSEPVSVLIRSVNKLSNNFMAEQLLRTLAREDGATAQSALDTIATYARDSGMPTDGLRLGNGSGLYDNNRVSAEQMTHLLARVYGDFRYRSDFIASLAVAGTEGTLRKRLRESPARQWVRGKTGTLDGVSALSGYAGAEGQTPYAFSILMNDLGRWETGAARRVQNQIAEQLSIEAASRGSSRGAPPRAD
jgi:D-alanyl-D-alanine carboxypeptidase/D-alanyl-D-alanine-endopeptidase (penicillin-binding protein 4)